MKKFFKDWTLFEKLLLGGATFLMCILSIIWKDSFVGFISTVTGIISVILCAKGKISNYVFGCIYVTTYAFIAYQNRFLGEVMLNLLYYLPMNFIGIFMWKKNMGASDDVTTKHMSKKMIIGTGIGSIIAILLYWQLLNLLGGNLAIIDSVTTVAAVLAMYLQVTRYTESWIMWIICNLTSIVLWLVALITQGSNNITMLVMWSAYLLNSIYGYINWRKLENNIVTE